MIKNLINFRYRYIYINRLKEIIDEHDTYKYRLKHRLIIILFMITIMRIIICMISYYTNVYNIWQYDPLFNFFIYDHPHLFQRYSIILLCALLFGVESEIKLCFSPINTITFQLPYELSVKNLDQCEQCMITEKEKETLLMIE